MSAMFIPAAFSISASASTKGTPSRVPSRRPIDDLPTPIMPVSTIERRPSRARIAAAETGGLASFSTAISDIYVKARQRPGRPGRAISEVPCQSGSNMIVLGPVRRHQWDEHGRLRCRACSDYSPSSRSCARPSMAVFMHSLISCNQSRARFRYRSRPTNSSRTIEGRTMARTTRSARAGAARNSDERLIALYLDMLAAERGAGKNTLAAYGRDLADFSAYLKRARSSIAKAGTAELRAYLGELSRQGLRVAAVARRLSAIRQLYRFLYAEGSRADDPAAVLEGPKRERALPKTLTLAEVDHLLRVAGKPDPAAPLALQLRAARLACLVEMLYATGLRVSELVALPMSAARQDGRVIVVRGKGNKERLGA